MDHLSGTLKRGGIRDLISFFPGNKQEGKYLEEHFQNANLPQVAEWYAKKQYAMVKDAIVKEVQNLVEHEESPEQVCPHFARTLLFLISYKDRCCCQSSTRYYSHPRSRAHRLPMARSDLIC